MLCSVIISYFLIQADGRTSRHRVERHTTRAGLSEVLGELSSACDSNSCTQITNLQVTRLDHPFTCGVRAPARMAGQRAGRLARK
jgi:hypothetical protein